MKLACVQTQVVFGDSEANLANAFQQLKNAAEHGIDLLVFPEAFLTGYMANSVSEGQAIALKADSDPLLKLKAKVDATKVSVIVGFIEAREGKIFNSAAFLSPHFETAIYRKTHLPFLGIDRFAIPGDSLPIFETPWGKIGILICFDQRPPEPARVMALNGADLIVLPTNWPVGAEISANHVCITRAAENKVFFATCNRVGVEKGAEFIGQSKIISPTGQILASAENYETVLVAEVDLLKAREKRTVLVPGEYELDILACRQPILYTKIVEQILELARRFQ